MADQNHSEAALPDETAGVIAPPPVLYLAGLAAGYGLQRLRPAPLLGRAGRPLGLAAVAGGLALVVSAAAAQGRAGTRPEPHIPTSAITTEGPYRFTRNPMYVAFALISAGIAALADNRWMLLLLGPSLAVVQRGVVEREERYLERRFGQDYRDYRARVRRWV